MLRNLFLVLALAVLLLAGFLFWQTRQPVADVPTATTTQIAPPDTTSPPVDKNGSGATFQKEVL